jgi:predicted Zn-dependent protease
MNEIFNLLGRCANCEMKTECPHFKEEYKRIKNEALTYALPKYEELKNNKILTPEGREKQEEKLQEQIENKIKELLENNNKECILEKELIQQTITELDTKFEFEKNQFLLTPLRQLIKLQVQDFRMMSAYKKIGVLKEVSNKTIFGVQKVPQLTPGLNYNIEIADKIMGLIDKMYKLLFEQNINININREVIDINTIIGDDVKEVGEFKEIKMLGEKNGKTESI